MVTVANAIQNDQLRQNNELNYLCNYLGNYKNWMFNFVSLLKYKRQMASNKLCVNLLRYAAHVYTFCYPSSDVYTSINWQN